jgi:hypothetical protein
VLRAVNSGHRRVEETQAAVGAVGRHRLRGVVVEEVGTTLLDSLEETGAVPVWKRRGRVILPEWAADLKRAVQIRVWETELARAVRESDRMGRCSHRRLDVRALVLPLRITSSRICALAMPSCVTSH